MWSSRASRSAVVSDIRPEASHQRQTQPTGPEVGLRPCQLRAVNCELRLRGLAGLVAGAQRLIARRAVGHVRLDELRAHLLGRVAHGLLVAAGGLLADVREVRLHAVVDPRLGLDLLLTRLDGLLDLRVVGVGAATAGVLGRRLVAARAATGVRRLRRGGPAAVVVVVVAAAPGYYHARHQQSDN